jgi:hypothetical protein
VFGVSRLIVSSKGHFSFALRNSLVCFLFLLSLKVLVGLSLFGIDDLIFFSLSSEFFLESEPHVFFQVFVFALLKTLKIKVLEY